MSDIKKTWKEDWEEAKTRLKSHQKPSDYLKKVITDIERQISYRQKQILIREEKGIITHTDVILDNLKLVLIEMRKSLRLELKREERQLNKKINPNIDNK